MVNDFGESGMMKSGQKTRLALELLTQLLFCKKCLFQRYRGIKSLVESLVDRSHSALTQLANNAIAILQNGVWFKHLL